MIRKKTSFIILILILTAGTIFAAPSGGNVVAGDANIIHNGNNTTINQGSDKAIINWDSFGINKGESVHFNQLNANSIILNRVIGSHVSNINGQMTGNGKVFLLNGNGIIIGNGASIDLGSFVASTGRMSNADFLNNKYNITDIQGDIENHGSITVDNYGYAALLGRRVTNTGVITANLGRIDIASGESFRLSFYDNNLIGIEIEKGIAEAYVSNTGEISAEGGTIYIAAKGLSDLIQSTVNNEGIIYAGSISNNAGRVILSADNGKVVNSSLIDVSSDIGYGGSVEISGDTIIHSGDKALIDATGNTGGDVYINSTKETTLNNGSIISANGKGSNGGNIYVLSDGITFFDKTASLFSKSINGDGGFVEVSAMKNVTARGTVNTLSLNGKGGTYLIDPTDIVITDEPTTNSGSTSYILISDMQAALGSNGIVYILQTDTVGFEEGNITIHSSAQGVHLDAPRGKLVLQASKDIILKGPNWDLGSLSMIAANDVIIKIADDPLKTSQITLTSDLKSETGGSFSSTGVNLTIPKLSFITYNGDVTIDTVVGAIDDIGGNITGDFSLKSVENIEITDSILSATNITLETTENIEVTFDGELIASNVLNIDSDQTVIIEKSSFTELSAKGSHLIITNYSLKPVTINKFEAVTSATYTQISPVFLKFLNITAPIIPGGTINIINRDGTIELPYDDIMPTATSNDYLKFNIDVNTITLVSDGDIMAGAPGAPLGDNNFIQHFDGDLGSPKFLTLKSKNGGSIYLNYGSGIPVNTLSLISEGGNGNINATCVDSCTFTGLFTKSEGDINITGFGATVMSAISHNGDVDIILAKQAGTTTLPAISFSALQGQDVTLTASGIDISSTFRLIIYEADMAKLDFDISGNPLLTMYGTGLAKQELTTITVTPTTNFNKFNVNLANDIELGTSFNLMTPESIMIRSTFGNISFTGGGDIIATKQLVLEAEKITGATGFAVTSPFLETEKNGIYINTKSEENIAINITADNEGLLNLKGNITATLNADTTIGNVTETDGIALAGNITIKAGIHDLTIGDRSELTNLTVIGTNVDLLTTANINATESIIFNLSGGITGNGDTTGQAFMSADNIEITAATIGGDTFADSAERLKLYATTAIFTTTDTGDPSINIESGDPTNEETFIQALFRYQFKATAPGKSYLNGRLVNPKWHDALNDSREVNFRPIFDLADIYKLDFNIYDNLLALGDDLIISDIVYPKYIHTIFKNRSSTTGNFQLK